MNVSAFSYKFVLSARLKSLEFDTESHLMNFNDWGSPTKKRSKHFKKLLKEYF